MSLLMLLWMTFVPGQAHRKPAPPPVHPKPFTTDLTLEQMAHKQAVIQTAFGPIVIDLRPDLAPNHVGYFMKLAGEHALDGTTFHRVIRDGIIQGGDPLSKDPSKAAQYGTGGLGALKAEHSAEPFTRGTVAAVIRPGEPDSAGSQFFVCVSDQPALAGQYTVFGHVSEGLDVAQKISELAADAKNVPAERVEMTSVTIRDTPPPAPLPFAADTVEQLAAYRAVIETSLGAITIGFYPDRAPEHVRNFLRLAQAGVYDGTAFHRVVTDFVIQGGYLTTRGPLTEKQQTFVHNLQPEFSDTKHVKGIVSMARGDDPASATTSFFIVTGPAPSLDGKYTVFGHVVDGMDVLDRINAVPVNGEAPVDRIEVSRVRIVK